MREREVLSLVTDINAVERCLDALGQQGSSRMMPPCSRFGRRRLTQLVADMGVTDL
jgi:hypothetical protein